MTAAAEIPRTTPASDARKAISEAVRRVDAVQIDVNLGRLLVHWLSGYAKLAEARYGCTPEGLSEAMYALAEACAARGDSQPASPEAILAPVVSELVDTKKAASVLGIAATTVRYHYKQGTLAGRKVGQTLMIDTSSLEQLRARREREEV
jgi:hypothetical protein